MIDAHLLSRPTAKLQDTSDGFHRARKYIDFELRRKAASFHPNREKKIAALIQEYNSIYERTKAKEEELKGTEKDPNERPFYYIRIAYRFHSEVLGRIRMRMAASDSYKEWRNNAVPKVFTSGDKP